MSIHEYVQILILVSIIYNFWSLNFKTTRELLHISLGKFSSFKNWKSLLSPDVMNIQRYYVTFNRRLKLSLYRGSVFNFKTKHFFILINKIYIR